MDRVLRILKTLARAMVATEEDIGKVLITRKLFTYPTRPAAPCTVRICCGSLFLFPLLVSPATSDALVVTIHAINTLTCLGKHKFVNPVAANFAFETVGVIRVVAGHDCFV